MITQQAKPPIFSRPFPYLIAVGMLTLGLLGLLFFGYGALQSKAFNVSKAGSAAQWVSALFAAVGSIAVFYQLRMLYKTAERARLDNLEMVDSRGMIVRWMRQGTDPGWLITVNVENAGDGAIWVTGLQFSSSLVDIREHWVIHDPDTTTLRQNDSGELSSWTLSLPNIRVMTGVVPVGAIHVPDSISKSSNRLPEILTIAVQCAVDDVNFEQAVSLTTETRLTTSVRK